MLKPLAMGNVLDGGGGGGLGGGGLGGRGGLQARRRGGMSSGAFPISTAWLRRTASLIYHVPHNLNVEER